VNRRVLSLAASLALAGGGVGWQATSSAVVAFLLPLLLAVLVIAAAVVVVTLRRDAVRAVVLDAAFERWQAAERARRRAAAQRAREGADR
jgi:hypothetical protein